MNTVPHGKRSKSKNPIKNRRIVTAVDDYNADIFIENEKVSVIGKTLDIEVDKTIDAHGKLVIPGRIDPHTHMEFPLVRYGFI